jgi:hypothetical protein
MIFAEKRRLLDEGDPVGEKAVPGPHELVTVMEMAGEGTVHVVTEIGNDEGKLRDLPPGKILRKPGKRNDRPPDGALSETREKKKRVVLQDVPDEQTGRLGSSEAGSRKSLHIGPDRMSVKEHFFRKAVALDPDTGIVRDRQGRPGPHHRHIVRKAWMGKAPVIGQSPPRQAVEIGGILSVDNLPVSLVFHDDDENMVGPGRDLGEGKGRKKKGLKNRQKIKNPLSFHRNQGALHSQSFSTRKRLNQSSKTF